MSLRKCCSPTLPTVLVDSRPNPMHCPSSPNCDHHWFYDFRVNQKRYRCTTETANKQDAKKIEAKTAARMKWSDATYLSEYHAPNVSQTIGNVRYTNHCR